jgi:hypothetical protein
MGNTANNNWPYPESSDLVKDGATAIENLADAIDTTLGVYSPATPMGVHLSTVSFSGVSSQSLPASTFTATYENYRCVLTLDGANSGAQGISLRLRASGTDNSASNYQYRRHGVVGGTNFVDSPATTTSFATILDANPLSNNSIAFDLLLPFATGKTKISGLGVITASTDLYIVHYGGQMTVTTSYDSATIISSSGNMSGQWSVYGYNL